MARTAITINRSTTGSGIQALQRLLARAGIQVRVDYYAVALAAISLVVVGPMLQPGYFWGAHDARHAVYFLFEFDRVFTDGVLYPRWFPDMTYGYGYPLFNIYGPLAFYVGEFVHLVGADFVTAVKFLFAVAWVLSGLAMYGFVKRVFENRAAAFIAGLLYVFTPYHMVDVYVRAALAESFALPFLPLTLWAFYETVTVRSIRSVLFAALAYAGMVLAHNGIALLFSLVLGAWILFLLLRTYPLRRPLWGRGGFLSKSITGALPTVGAVALGLSLTGIFMLPLVLEYRYINVAQWTQNYYNYQDHFVEFFQLFSPFWGFGISNLGPVDGLSFQLGLVPVVLALLALYVIARNPNGKRAYVGFFMVLTLVVILLMFDFSLPAWRVFGLASVAQFPWRLLTLTMVSLSIIGGSVLLLTDDARMPQAGARVPEVQDNADLPRPPSAARHPFSLSMLALGALIVLASYPYITSQNILDPKEGPVGLSGLMAFENSANEMTGTTVYADEQPRWSPLADNFRTHKRVNSKIDFSTKPASVFIRVTPTGLRTTGEHVDYNAPDGDATLIFNVQMYPGWRAFLTPARSDEPVRELPIQIEPPYGRIKVTIPQGEHGLTLRFQDTPPRTIGTILSGLSLLVVAGLVLIDSRLRRKNQSANH